MTKEAECPEEEEDSPRQRKAEHPESQHRLPVGAVMPRPEETGKNLTKLDLTTSELHHTPELATKPTYLSTPHGQVQLP
jgi:hypothetical protein